MKAKPMFTWYRWGIGVEKWGYDDRIKCANMLQSWRKDHRFTLEIVAPGFYRVIRNDVAALIRTR